MRKHHPFRFRQPRGFTSVSVVEKAGDAIEFIKEIEGLNYIQAMGYLGKKYGIQVEEEEDTPEEIERQSLRESLFIVLGFAKDYFHDLLLNSA